MKRQMKTALILISVIAFISAVIVGVWYYKTKFYIPDKNGMVFSLTDTINFCCYESGGGMNGELTEARIYVKDNGEVLKYSEREYYSFNSGHILPDGSEKIFDEISEIINQYKQGDD